MGHNEENGLELWLFRTERAASISNHVRLLYLAVYEGLRLLSHVCLWPMGAQVRRLHAFPTVVCRSTPRTSSLFSLVQPSTRLILSLRLSTTTTTTTAR